ncbi:Fic family protein [Candidatus Palauibacter sp.]|uniref:Fic family protein n=1 Tax=Candidatus Palauibacter sp. TaxID=3101350 RepID=UPI003AF24A16
MSNDARRPVGQAWLFRHFDLAVPRPAVRSYVVAGARRTERDGPRTTELYPLRYAAEDSIVAHLRFALRHEAFDLGVLVAALREIDPAVLETWVRAQPTGAFSRRAWFLYETFSGRTLDLEDAKAGNYAGALDHNRHMVATRRNSRRHRVADNLLGGAELCPVVRLTSRLRKAMKSGLDEEARDLMESYDPSILARAVNYLFAKETRSSFALEGETPSGGRAERFAQALKSASAFDPADKADLLRLHAAIVDPRYAADDWRTIQNFVGETIGGYRERVHFICPRPADVPGLMRGWTALTGRVVDGGVDPVVAAAVSSFAFVFVHPFEDGNGRIHRFLIHHVLARRGYGPPGTILPVSAAILRDRQGYDDILSGFSRSLLDLIRWGWSGGGADSPSREMVVESDSADLYRYFDATSFAEYLYGRVADSVRRDLKEELGFVAVFDRAFKAVQEIVDMPDRRASLFVRLCMQNGGRLAARKRGSFAELTDDEVRAMEAAVREAMAAQGSA